MGNYTWIFKCISNISTEEPIVDIVEFLSQHRISKDWWFEDWLETLPEEQQVLFADCEDLSPDEFRKRFSMKISMNDSMLIFNDRKLYGYIDDDLREFLDSFARCIPENAFMMMLGIYEGFGPVALGWVDGKFVSMMGFEHRCFGGSDLMEELNMSKEEYLKNAGGEDEYQHMIRFKNEILDPLETINWGDVEDDNIVSWLSRRGFEKDSKMTNVKQYNMMGCPHQ